MAARPQARSWDHVQMAIASVAMVATLGLWNLFAGPDRERADASAAQLAALPADLPAATVAPTPMPSTRILFGATAAPQTVTQTRTRKGHHGGGAVTSTRSS